MKKIKIITIFILMFMLTFLFSFQKGLAVNLVPLKKTDGTNLKYRGTNVDVMIPSEYVAKDSEFRAVWVTRLVGDINFSSESSYKSAYLNILDKMEEYNLNAIIYHVRINHDALYNSNLNIRSHYLSGVNPEWDSLKWLIEETHKRGIEFHAWLNPYRVRASGAVSAESEAARFPSSNIASNPENLLVASGRSILNPGEPAVRQFLIDTVVEIMDNYDVDAIHFDDYFYVEGVDDAHTRIKPGYNPNNLSVADWRREQINIFIQDLSITMRNYNAENNRYVQLGISPTGIYKNGAYGVPYGGYDSYNANGNFITNGSNTGGFEHYGAYLYSDTKKWIDEEWIDYILPQTYWSFEHPVAAYADLVEWWAKVVRHKKVNLYTGMGLYRAAELTNTHSWKTNQNEAPNQVIFNTKLPEVLGTSIYSYRHIVNPTGPAVTGVNILKNQLWTKKVLRPTVKSFSENILPKVDNLRITSQPSSNLLTWNNLNEARGYVVYRSEGEINFNDTSQIIDILGFDNNSTVSFTDNVDPSADYTYGVRAINGANQLGEGSIISLDGYRVNLQDNKSNNLLSVSKSLTSYGYLNSLNVNNNPNYRYLFLTEDNKIITSEESYSFYTVKNHSFKGYFTDVNKFGVAFASQNNDLISFQEVSNASEIVAPLVPESLNGYTFSHWSYPIEKVQQDMIIRAVYVKEDKETFQVEIFDGVSTNISDAPYGTKLILTPNETILNDFSHWKVNGEMVSFDVTFSITIYSHMTIEAVVGNNVKTPLANIQDKVTNLNGSLAFVGSYYLPESLEFIEVGIILTLENSLDFDLNSINIIKAQALKISNNNEFAIIKENVLQSENWHGRTYLTYKDNDQTLTVYSQVVSRYNIEEDNLKLSSIISTVPLHITGDYRFPTDSGVSWSYEDGMDSSLFDLSTGTMLIQRLTTQKRTLIATLNSSRITIEVNFGFLADDEVGSFYRGEPGSVSVHEGPTTGFIGWGGYTLTRGNEVHFVRDIIELEGSGLITDIEQLKPTTDFTSVGKLFINIGHDSISFRIGDLDENSISNDGNYSKVLIGSDGTVKRVIKEALPLDEVITLLPGEAFWSARYLDKSYGLTWGAPDDFDGITHIIVKKH